MKKKIIFSMSCIALLSILLSMVLSGVVSYYDSLEIVKKATIAESHYIQNGIALGGDDYLSDVRSAGDDTAAAQSVRVTVIDTDGTVRFDSVADAANMENHNNRPEVIAARENGAGESVRESDTLNVQSYNYAVMLSDGRVLRLSVGMKTVFGSIERMVPWMLLCSVIILVLAILLSTYRTKQIVAPVNAIDLDHPMENDVYGELSPLLLRLQRQNETIKEKMEELHRKQTEFTAITENMREGFIVVDAKGDVLSYNTSAVRLLDVHPEDDRPQSVLAFNRSPDFRDAVDSALTGTASERITKLAGRSYSLIANPVTNDNGVQGAVIVLLDVTEKEENERLRREFTANVSHELRTPLTAIKGWAETLQTGGIGRETYDKGMNVIVREAERLSGMVEELLDFSRMQSGRMRLILKKIDLLAELDEAVYMFTDRARTEHKNLIYDEEDTMLSPILGDVNRLRQVFINVIDNALKYTNPGGTVRVSAYEDDGFIRVIIKDSGCGIPAEHLPNVKKKFYKANQNVRGNGIGLAVANEIMELHSGSLDVDSEEGMGTTVIITIPTMKKLEMNPELSNTTQIPTATAQVQVVERKQD